jgi:hypothetical protein
MLSGGKRAKIRLQGLVQIVIVGSRRGHSKGHTHE